MNIIRALSFSYEFLLVCREEYNLYNHISHASNINRVDLYSSEGKWRR